MEGKREIERGGGGREGEKGREIGRGRKRWREEGEKVGISVAEHGIMFCRTQKDVSLYLRQLCPYISGRRVPISHTSVSLYLRHLCPSISCSREQRQASDAAYPAHTRARYLPGPDTYRTLDVDTPGLRCPPGVSPPHALTHHALTHHALTHHALTHRASDDFRYPTHNQAYWQAVNAGYSASGIKLTSSASERERESMT